MVHPSVFFCILCAIFVATPTGEVSEVKIFLHFDGVPGLALSSVFARTCSQQSVFFRVHPLSVRGLTFTCMRGSVIFSNMLDFAVYAWTTCLRRLDKPLVKPRKLTMGKSEQQSLMFHGITLECSRFRQIPTNILTFIMPPSMHVHYSSIAHS